MRQLKLRGMAERPGAAPVLALAPRSVSSPRPRSLGATSALAPIASGLAAALTVAPFDQGWLIWFAFVPLLLAVERCGGGLAAFLLGFGSGLTLFTALSYGLLAYYPEAFVVLVLGLAALYASVFSARQALASAAPWWLRPFLLPALWVLAEVSATVVDAPWSAALTQVRHPLWLQSASLFGAHVVSFEILLVNAALFEICSAWSRGGRAALRARRPWYAPAVAGALVGAAALFGTWALTRPSPGGASVSLASIQPVVLPDVYTYQGLEPRHRRALGDLVAELSAEALAARPDLMLWPEGGNGRYNFRVAALRDELTSMARRSGAAMLVSSYDLDSEARLFNAVYSVASSGDVLGRYAKTRLTPFGERHFTPGGDLEPLPTPFGPAGALVCFESTFSSLARTLVAKGAEMLVITSSDASFLHSSLPALHAGSAVYRAVENGRPVVLASNAGPSLVVSDRGEITAETRLFERTVLRGRIEPRRGRTLYSRLGDAPLLAACVAVVGAGVGPWARRRTRRVILHWRAALPALALCLAAGTVAGSGAALASLAVASHGVDRFGAAFGDRVAALLHPATTQIRPDTANMYLQTSPTSCGPAALAYLLSYLGAETAERDLMPLVHLTAQGTSLADLATAAKARGFAAWGEKQNWAALRQMPKPLLAHVRDDHYVVVLSTEAENAVDVFDPAEGYRRIARESFLRDWQGNVLVVRFRDDAPAEGGARPDQRAAARPDQERP